MKRVETALNACLAGLLALAGLWSGGCAEDEGTPRDVLLITLDTTRADAVGSYGSETARTPYLDELADSALRFEQAVSSTPYTGASHASILTGLFPPQHGLRDFMKQRLSKNAVTLAEVLRQQGFATGAFVSAYVLDPRYGFDQGFEYYGSGLWQPSEESEGEVKKFIERPAANTVSEAAHWLSLQPEEKPVFAWVHLFDPHAPYAPPHQFRWRGVQDLDPGDRKRALYYSEASYADDQIGRLLDEFKQSGRYRDLVVVVVADHGELLGEHGRPAETHATMLVDATTVVPLIIRVPGVSPAVVDRQVRTVDIFPTVLSALDIPISNEVAGQDLLALASEQGEDLPAYSETFLEFFPDRAEDGQELRSLRVDGYKLKMRPGRIELYDLKQDPDELVNVASKRPEQVHRLAKILEELAADWPEGVRPDTFDLSAEEEEEHLEALRALGYVE